jgi:hypothetical protein
MPIWSSITRIQRRIRFQVITDLIVSLKRIVSHPTLVRLILFNSSNLDNTKNYDFGGSKLSHNPITNPVNSYQFNYNKFRQPVLMRQAQTEILEAQG